MAEVAATAIGIAGLVGVFQSLLQVYKDFLTARDFVDDFMTVHLQLLLLENSITMWGLSTGLIMDEAGTPSPSDHKWLVAKSNERQRRLAEASIRQVTHLIATAKAALDVYTVGETDPVMESASKGALPSGMQPSSDLSRRKKVVQKFDRMLHRKHDQQHPGTMKRTTWALVVGGRIKEDVEDITNLVNGLTSNFPPVSEDTHLARFNQVFHDLELDHKDLQLISADVTDDMAKKATGLAIEAQRTGKTFESLTLTGNAIHNVGDAVGPAFTGQFLATSNDSFGKVELSGNSFANFGNTYGVGESSVDKALRLREERLKGERVASAVSD